MDMKRHLKSSLKQLGFDKPSKAQIIPMNTLDAGQDAIVIAATGSGKQVIYETVGLAHSDKLTIVIEPLLALIYNQVQTLQGHDVSADYIDMTRSKEDIDKIINIANLQSKTEHKDTARMVADSIISDIINNPNSDLNQKLASNIEQMTKKEEEPKEPVQPKATTKTPTSRKSGTPRKRK